MIKALFQRYFLPQFNPSREELSELVSNTDALLKRLEAKIEAHIIPENAVISLRGNYYQLKTDHNFDSDGISEDEWKKIPDEGKSDLFFKIRSIRHALLGINRPDLIIGSIVLIIVLSFLAGSSWVYLHLHQSSRKEIEGIRPSITKLEAELKTISDSNNPEQWKEASRILQNLKDLLAAVDWQRHLEMLENNIKEKKLEASATVVQALDKDFERFLAGENASRNDILEIQPLLTQLSAQLGKTTDSSPPEEWEASQKTLADLKKTMSTLDWRFPTKKHLGALEGNLEAKNHTAAQTALQRLEKTIDRDLADTFFWTRAPLQWLEIGWWAFFGVLVGIIFYLAKQLKLGIFDRQDVPSICGEIFIAPIVTCVIFFLLPKTEITEFSPSEDTILLVLGFAFLFGYAIRRTVGLLENIKRRIFPQP
jgi:hypothetical protein